MSDTDTYKIEKPSADELQTKGKKRLGDLEKVICGFQNSLL